ncbi:MULTISPECIES: ATP-dependent helicase HrpB [Corynebacterium]|uniref:ATP-dependent helicase HrpB n=1 Tax=Corynebacterium TaxID=1716 RepID=UPI00124C5B97|nr:MULTISPECIES: ATP-dependent helicase HrpB [Corynebacterium]
MTFPCDLGAIGAGLPVARDIALFQQRLAQGGATVVHAPPGTGKTTLIPPAVANLLHEQSHSGKVLVTAPRRVAVIAAAQRLRQLHHGPRTDIGFAVRGQSEAGRLIEFVTPGVLVRMLLSDPELSGIDAVILDEVHERNLDTDLALGMLAELRLLREDLQLVAMSATVDAHAFATLIDATLHQVDAALHPVDIRYQPGPARLDERGVTREFLSWTARVADEALAESTGSVLVFLPGRREIERVAEQLHGRHAVLHGGLSAQEQGTVVRGTDQPRIVLSTAIAESSITVPGVHTVVDAGLARVPRRDNLRAMTGLITISAARAAMDQRAGRAGRLGPGTAIRLCEQRSYAAAPAYAAPEIATSDLTQAALTLASWGSPRGEGFPLLDAPPPAALAAAEEVLRGIGAVDKHGAITEHGRRISTIPADPRCAHALLQAGPAAAPVLAELTVGSATDLSAPSSSPQVARETRRFTRIALSASSEQPAHLRQLSAGGVIALALPHMVARLVDADQHVYLTTAGTRARLLDTQLRGSEWLAVAEMSRGTNQQALPIIRRAAAVSEEQILQLYPPTSSTAVRVRQGKLSARTIRSIAAIELASTPTAVPVVQVEEAVARAFERDGLRDIRFSAAAQQLRQRMAFYHAHDPQWPDVSDAGLIAAAPIWLSMHYPRLAEGMPLAEIDMHQALRSLLPWPAAQDFDKDVPASITVPSGRSIPVDYSDKQPSVQVKLQECFGLEDSPEVLGTRIRFELLSPAGRPVAITDNLTRFWDGAYADVRADMRGRYPKHPWPEDPRTAPATRKTTAQLLR